MESGAWTLKCLSLDSVIWSLCQQRLDNVATLGNSRTKQQQCAKLRQLEATMGSTAATRLQDAQNGGNSATTDSPTCATPGNTISAAICSALSCQHCRTKCLHWAKGHGWATLWQHCAGAQEPLHHKWQSLAKSYHKMQPVPTAREQALTNETLHFIKATHKQPRREHWTPRESCRASARQQKVRPNTNTAPQRHHFPPQRHHFAPPRHRNEWLLR